MKKNGKTLVTPRSAANRLSCSVKTVRRLVDDGELEALKVRGGLRITDGSIDAYIKRQILEFQTKDGIPEDN